MSNNAVASQQEVEQQQVQQLLVHQQQQQLNEPEHQTIWKGILEWKEVIKLLGEKSEEKQIIPRTVPCIVSVSVKNEEIKLKAESWPEKLIIQLIPMVNDTENIGVGYLEDSNKVFFTPTPCKALESITKYLTSGYCGYVYLNNSAPTSPNCDSKILVLLSIPDRKDLIGFIPKNQPAYLDRFCKLIPHESDTVQRQNNDGQMLTDSICINTVKSPESCNRSRDNFDSSTSVEILDILHLKTSNTLKNTNCIEDNKSVETCKKSFVSQATSKKNQSEMILNLIKKNDLDNKILDSEDEKLILEIANKNKNLILPLDISQMNTQEFMELNLDIITRTLEESHTHFDTSKKDIVENINSDVIVLSSSQSSSPKNVQLSIENGKTFDKKKNSKCNSKMCTVDLTQDSETLSKTQFQNLKPSHSQHHTSIKNMDSNDILVVSSPLSSNSKNVQLRIANGKTLDKTKNSTCNTKCGTIDLDLDFEILDETQGSKTSNKDAELSKQDQNDETKIQNVKSSHRQSETPTIEMVEVMSSDDISSPVFFKLNDFIESDKNGENVSKIKSFTHNATFGTIDLDQNSETLHESQSPKTSNHGTELSEDQVSELNSFRFMCDKLMLKVKPLIDIDYWTRNDKMIGFTKCNPDVLKCVSFTNCDSTADAIKSSFYPTHSKNSNKISKMSLKRKISSEKKNESLQIHSESLNKKLKLTSSHNTLTTGKSKSTLNNISVQPKVSNSVNCVALTSSKDEDDRVLVKNKLPKVQDTSSICTQKSFVDLSKTNKRCTKVKPIFKCSPNGEIHKDMLKYIEKKKKS